jgi:hypothetical protein
MRNVSAGGSEIVIWRSRVNETSDHCRDLQDGSGCPEAVICWWVVFVMGVLIEGVRRVWV